MRAPICSVCLQSGMLCRTCREKVDGGDISDTDVCVSGKLLKMSGRIRSLRDITIERVVESPNLFVIVCGKGDAAKVIGRDGSTAKKLEHELGKPVKVIETTPDVSQFVTDLLEPVAVQSVNIVYRPQGEVLRVLIGKGSGPRFPAVDFRMVVKSLFGKDIEIEVA